MAEKLANKYRPKTFDDVVGQEKILTILQNQIARNQTKQAYLFTGGAGTGKTTVARIFGQEINEGKGNLIEIDAASNNGVDHVREIRESCKFKPLDSRFKVYIIDEVHMLSTGAFNALLKILEEPPEHVIFILCTTDPQKIPPTILSRVQRFDFKRMTTGQIVDRLRHVIFWESESHTLVVTNDVLDYIAKLANGGMRDAISLLDTCLGYKDDLEIQDVFEILGTPSYENFAELLRHLQEGGQEGRTGIIQVVEYLHLTGKDLKVFVKGLLEFIVELMKYKLFKNIDQTAIPDIYEQQVDDLVFSRDNPLKLTPLFDGVNAMYQRVKYEHQPRVLIEGELIALCQVMEAE